ncbi:MAG: helix-turn-helix domain-containing protein [Bauldia sp.]|nr:helix-turn-helix domain-containing protein [Bauldia sp.]
MNDEWTMLAAPEAAKLTGLSPSTLAKLRLTGRGPAYCKLGRRVLYRPSDLTDWLDLHRRRSTSEPQSSAA